MDWSRDLPTWPLHHLSRRIASKPHQWHVQESGSGPLLLLLHGAGASTHSFRALIPALSQTHRVIALDLPGQGFTRAGTKTRCGLEPMTADIAHLCQQEGWHPDVILGHSAGAALALNLASRLSPAPKVIALNAALGRFEGVAGWLFPVLAKVLALNPLTAMAFTLGGNPTARARRLIAGTGSTLDDEGYALYARLIADRAHVDCALQMMAQWNIDPLADRLPQITARTLFIAADNDRAVPPETSDRAAAIMPNAALTRLPGLGHLAHEEDPETVLAHITGWLADTTV